MASASTLSFIMQVSRAALNRGTKEFDTVVTLQDILQFTLVEQTLGAGAIGVPVNFNSITSAVGVLIFTSKPIGIKLNGSSTPVQTGSQFVLLDTLISSLNLDNNILTPAAVQTVEVWLASKT